MNLCQCPTRDTAFIIMTLKRHPHMQLAGAITMVGLKAATIATTGIPLPHKKKIISKCRQSTAPTRG